jgi:hypothetical protein
MAAGPRQLFAARLPVPPHLQLFVFRLQLYRQLQRVHLRPRLGTTCVAVWSLESI